MARVVANPAFVQDWVAENGANWSQQAGEMGLGSILSFVPIDTGELEHSGTHEPFIDSEGRPATRITLFARHAEYVDQGTGLFGKYARKITSPTGKVMRWMGPEGPIFARSTRGQPGQRFFLRGLSAVFRRVDEHRWGD